MSAAASVQLDRAATNRANALHSTGPRTTAGKLRSSQNALRHGLTAASPVLPSENPATYEGHCRAFQHEYQPATPTETHLVQELADASWRLRRIRQIEDEVLDDIGRPPQVAIDQIAKLGLYTSRLSRLFQKTVDQLRKIQSERHERERSDLHDAAELLALHQHEGTPWNPADDGFVFSHEQVAQHAHRLRRQKEATFCAAPVVGSSLLRTRDA